MVGNLGHQKRPVAIRRRNFEREGADSNVAMHRVSVSITRDLKWPYRGRFH
jgi:hypothetical protein